ncbi:MAG: hypothetical protein MHM6MM_005137 [Cercozoa sp. M6MM]
MSASGTQTGSSVSLSVDESHLSSPAADDQFDVLATPKARFDAVRCALALRELVSTERTHVSGLKLLKATGDVLRERNEVELTEWKRVFGSCSNILSAHTDFLCHIEQAVAETVAKDGFVEKLKELRRIINSGQNETKDDSLEIKQLLEVVRTVSGIVSKFAPSFRAASALIYTYESALSSSRIIGRDVIARALFDAETRLANKNAVRTKRVSTGGGDLGALLILPVQRLPRYKLLLSEIENQVTARFETASIVARAVQDVERLTRGINDGKHDFDRMCARQRMQLELINLHTSESDETESFLSKSKTELAKLDLAIDLRSRVSRLRRMTLVRALGRRTKRALRARHRQSAVRLYLFDDSLIIARRVDDAKSPRARPRGRKSPLAMFFRSFGTDDSNEIESKAANEAPESDESIDLCDCFWYERFNGESTEPWRFKVKKDLNFSNGIEALPGDAKQNCEMVLRYGFDETAKEAKGGSKLHFEFESRIQRDAWYIYSTVWHKKASL